MSKNATRRRLSCVKRRVKRQCRQNFLYIMHPNLKGDECRRRGRRDIHVVKAVSLFVFCVCNEWFEIEVIGTVVQILSERGSFEAGCPQVFGSDWQALMSVRIDQAFPNSPFTSTYKSVFVLANAIVQANY